MTRLIANIEYGMSIEEKTEKVGVLMDGLQIIVDLSPGVFTRRVRGAVGMRHGQARLSDPCCMDYLKKAVMGMSAMVRNPGVASVICFKAFRTMAQVATSPLTPSLIVDEILGSPSISTLS